MKNHLLIATSVLAVSMTLLSAWQYQQKTKIQAELAALQLASEESARQSKASMELLKNSVATIEKQLRDTRATADSAMGAAKDAAAAASSTIANQGNVAVPTAAQPKSASASMDDRLRQVWKSPEGRLSMSRNSVTSMVGEFLKSLHLAPAREAELMERLVNNQAKMMELQNQLSSGEITEEEFQAYSRSHGFDDIWAEYVDPQQMAALHQYVADAPIRNQAQAESQFYVQIAPQTPGLSDQNRSSVASAIAKSLAGYTQNTANRNKVGTIPMDRIYADAAAKLEGTMPDDQMKIVRDYFKRQSRLTVL